VCSALCFLSAARSPHPYDPPQIPVVQSVCCNLEDDTPCVRQACGPSAPRALDSGPSFSLPPSPAGAAAAPADKVGSDAAAPMQRPRGGGAGAPPASEPDILACMLGGEPWPTGATYQTPMEMIDADLGRFFHTLGFACVPDIETQKRLCVRVLDAMPATPGDSSVLGRNVRKSLLHQTFINTSVSVWLLRAFARHCGFTLGVSGCEDSESATAQQCRLVMDRSACKNKVVCDVELFTRVTDEHNAPAKRIAQICPTYSIDEDTVTEEPPVAAGTTMPVLPHSLRHCWSDLERGAQLCFLQLTKEHASAGVIDTQTCGASDGPRQAVCRRYCSLGWPIYEDEKYFVLHVTELLGMTVRWENLATPRQIWPDCILRGTFRQIEFELGTVGGTSSPTANQLTVHNQMQCARTWIMFKFSEAARAISPDYEKPLSEILQRRDIPATITTAQPSLPGGVSAAAAARCTVAPTLATSATTTAATPAAAPPTASPAKTARAVSRHYGVLFMDIHNF